jgi:hypothetical protein
VNASHEDKPETSPSGRAVSRPAACLSIVAAATALLLLAGLHVLSPEFDPSWRVISEYANGKYPWVLSLMFLTWGVSTWALAFAIRSQLTTIAGRLGLASLVAAGLGQAMSALCDINHPLHLVTGLLGVFGLPAAAMLISTELGRRPGWSAGRTALLWTAHATWVILVLMFAALAVMIAGRGRGGTIAIVGYPNRLLVVLDCAWAMTVAALAMRLPNGYLDLRQAPGSDPEERS